jgi:hypothetical protein
VFIKNRILSFWYIGLFILVAFIFKWEEQIYHTVKTRRVELKLSKNYKNAKQIILTRSLKKVMFPYESSKNWIDKNSSKIMFLYEISKEICWWDRCLSVLSFSFFWPLKSVTPFKLLLLISPFGILTLFVRFVHCPHISWSMKYNICWCKKALKSFLYSLMNTSNTNIKFHVTQRRLFLFTECQPFTFVLWLSSLTLFFVFLFLLTIEECYPIQATSSN